MAREYVPIFYDWMDVTEELNAQEKGRLIDAIVLYAQGGDGQEQIKGNERYLFPAFKRQIDRANEISSIKADSGSAGGKQTQAKSSKSKQTQANASKTAEKEKEKEKEEEEEDKDKEVCKKRTRFTPPTQEEVSAYCRERGNQVDAQRFVDFYGAKGWKVGNQPMKNWQAAVRTWEQRDGKPAVKTVSAQAYGQRNYTEDELLSVSDDLMAEAKAMRGAL